jgi:hypothetical protein
VRHNWPSKQVGNRFEYHPPTNLRKQCLSIFQRTERTGLRAFVIGAERRAEFGRVQHRFSSLCALEAELLAGVPFEAALERVSKIFHSNKNSLRQWASGYSQHGVAGLLERKLGRVGGGRKVKR